MYNLSWRVKNIHFFAHSILYALSLEVNENRMEDKEPDFGHPYVSSTVGKESNITSVCR